MHHLRTAKRGLEVLTTADYRRAEALGHVMAAWVLDATPEDECWPVSTDEVPISIYPGVAKVCVTIGMTAGDAREVAAARALLERAVTLL